MPSAPNPCSPCVRWKSKRLALPPTSFHLAQLSPNPASCAFISCVSLPSWAPKNIPVSCFTALRPKKLVVFEEFLETFGKTGENMDRTSVDTRVAMHQHHLFQGCNNSSPSLPEMYFRLSRPMGQSSAWTTPQVDFGVCFFLVCMVETSCASHSQQHKHALQ